VDNDWSREWRGARGGVVSLVVALTILTAYARLASKREDTVRAYWRGAVRSEVSAHTRVSPWLHTPL